MSGRVVVVDANVFYSIELTDLLVTFAAHRLVRRHWSSTILDEVGRNLAKRADLSPVAIAHRIGRMDATPDGTGSSTPFTSPCSVHGRPARWSRASRI
ncbi:MAG: hypothetical protein FJW83_01385 [Actinobacteria bacterium]|nr:hypothetical protein [Actinomycetota bacterium]